MPGGVILAVALNLKSGWATDDLYLFPLLFAERKFKSNPKPALPFGLCWHRTSARVGALQLTRNKLANGLSTAVTAIAESASDFCLAARFTLTPNLYGYHDSDDASG